MMAQENKTDQHKPVNPAFVLSNGIRVPFDLRYQGPRPPNFVWEPVIEGEVVKLMPMVVAIEADVWPPLAALLLPVLPGVKMSHEWVQRVLANSPCLRGAWALGKRWQK